MILNKTKQNKTKQNNEKTSTYFNPYTRRNSLPR